MRPVRASEEVRVPERETAPSARAPRPTADPPREGAETDRDAEAEGAEPTAEDARDGAAGESVPATVDTDRPSWRAARCASRSRARSTTLAGGPLTTRGEELPEALRRTAGAAVLSLSSASTSTARARRVAASTGEAREPHGSGRRVAGGGVTRGVSCSRSARASTRPVISSTTRAWRAAGRATKSSWRAATCCTADRRRAGRDSSEAPASPSSEASRDTSPATEGARAWVAAATAAVGAAAELLAPDKLAETRPVPVRPGPVSPTTGSAAARWPIARWGRESAGTVTRAEAPGRGTRERVAAGDWAASRRAAMPSTGRVARTAAAEAEAARCETVAAARASARTVGDGVEPTGADERPAAAAGRRAGVRGVWGAVDEPPRPKSSTEAGAARRGATAGATAGAAVDRRRACRADEGASALLGAACRDGPAEVRRLVEDAELASAAEVSAAAGRWASTGSGRPRYSSRTRPCWGMRGMGRGITEPRRRAPTAARATRLAGWRADARSTRAWPRAATPPRASGAAAAAGSNRRTPAGPEAAGTGRASRDAGRMDPARARSATRTVAGTAGAASCVASWTRAKAARSGASERRETEPTPGRSEAPPRAGAPDGRTADDARAAELVAGERTAPERLPSGDAGTDDARRAAVPARSALVVATMPRDAARAVRDRSSRSTRATAPVGVAERAAATGRRPRARDGEEALIGVRDDTTAAAAGRTGDAPGVLAARPGDTPRREAAARCDEAERCDETERWGALTTASCSSAPDSAAGAAKTALSTGELRKTGRSPRLLPLGSIREAATATGETPASLTDRSRDGWTSRDTGPSAERTAAVRARRAARVAPSRDREVPPPADEAAGLAERRARAVAVATGESAAPAVDSRRVWDNRSTAAAEGRALGRVEATIAWWTGSCARTTAARRAPTPSS